jgi:ABC-type multidrug transport system fused ATPase/permease subunit
MVIDEQITVGDLSSFMFLTVSLSGGLMMLERVIMSFLSALGVAERLFELMDVPVKVLSPA